jgi:hypothetical protein
MPDIFMVECPSVPVIQSSEVRFSIQEPLQIRPIFNWPLSHVTCGEITPSQLRTQWGVPVSGARYDGVQALRLGSSRNNLTLSVRSTSASADDRLQVVEKQRVGVASITLGGLVRFKYWNDHAFWWWPMGDGGDQGDTAGLQFSYNVFQHKLQTGPWTFEQFSLSLRLATGIPNRSSARSMGDGMVYTEVKFPEVDRGDIDVSAALQHTKLYRMDVGITVNSGQVRNAVQSKLVHQSLGIPEFPRTDQTEVMMYIRLTNW